MLTLNKEAEVSIWVKADNVEFTIKRLEENNWHVTIEDGMDFFKREYNLTDEQTSATLALFVKLQSNSPIP